IQDIVDSIKMIESYLTGIKSFSDYNSNYMLIDAVERRLSIIGEALWKASKLENIQVTDQKKIIGLRHILIHDYDLIDDASIWKIVQVNLKILKEELQKYLEQ
ncbi:MAG: HepT-like ribonuclease domain-containing protein, partial [Ginsengibacter sp.]